MSDYQRRLERTDCRNAGPFYEMSGSHCPPDKPCDRCLWEREEARLRKALEQIAEGKIHDADIQSFALDTLNHD